PELINLYAHIGEVPMTIWTASAWNAGQVIDIATDVVPALPHDLSNILGCKAREGVQVRLCLGAMTVSTVRIDGASVRVHQPPGMINIYRFDEEMVVLLNRGGLGVEYAAPALHLRQAEEHGAFSFYCKLFTRLWDSGE